MRVPFLTPEAAMSIPKGTRWGVDSFLPIHKAAGDKKTLLEFVTGKTKEICGT